MTKNRTRIEYIDIAKGLGMLLVIWGHIRETGISNAMVYAFHMPLFFFLSGMMFDRHKYSSVAELIKRRIKTLLIPYLLFSVATWIFWAGYNLVLGNEVKSYWMPLLQTVISQGSGGYLVHNSPLWFVTCLFMVEMIYYFASRFSVQWTVIICVLCAVAGNFMIAPESPLRYLPWSFDMAMCAVPFYMLGNLVSEYLGHERLCGFVNQRKALSIFLVLLGIVFLYFGAIINGPVSMGHRKLNIEYVFYPLACIGIAEHLILSILLSNIPSKAVGLIRWIGNYSFRVMAVQTPIKGVVLVVLGFIFHKTVGELSDTTSYSILAFVISLIAVCITVWVIYWLVSAAKRKQEPDKELGG